MISGGFSNVDFRSYLAGLGFPPAAIDYAYAAASKAVPSADTATNTADVGRAASRRLGLGATPDATRGARRFGSAAGFMGGISDADRFAVAYLIERADPVTAGQTIKAIIGSVPPDQRGR